MLPILSLGQGRTHTLRETQLWRPHEAPTPRLLRRLSRTRHFDGYDVERCRRHGRCSPPCGRKRDVPAASDVGTFGGGGNYEAGAYHYLAEQGRLDQGASGT